MHRCCYAFIGCMDWDWDGRLKIILDCLNQCDLHFSRTTISFFVMLALPSKSAAMAQNAPVRSPNAMTRVRNMIKKTTFVRSEQMRKTKHTTPMKRSQNPDQMSAYSFVRQPLQRVIMRLRLKVRTSVPRLALNPCVCSPSVGEVALGGA